MAHFGARSGWILWRQNVAKGLLVPKARLGELVAAFMSDGVRGALRVARFVTFGVVGQGDILGVTPGGRFISIEVKSSRGREREAQKNWRRAVRSVGGIAIVARSVADVEQGLRDAGCKEW